MFSNCWQNALDTNSLVMRYLWDRGLQARKNDSMTMIMDPWKIPRACDGTQQLICTKQIESCKSNLLHGMGAAHICQQSCVANGWNSFHCPTFRSKSNWIKPTSIYKLYCHVNNYIYIILWEGVHKCSKYVQYISYWLLYNLSAVYIYIANVCASLHTYKNRIKYTYTYLYVYSWYLNQNMIYLHMIYIIYMIYNIHDHTCLYDMVWYIYMCICTVHMYYI